MKRLVGLVVSLLVAALISPAFAQPFADTPTNHWAYDAIAELAAKGLIEGYPDGTFKGDRAVTRYEMAMVVARLVARIESIQIPAPAPPPKPEVTKADIDMILRLVNEFRAELAAKNVRLGAVEEELNAIKAKLDTVRVTGAYRFREDLDQQNPAMAGVPGFVNTSLNGNPRTSTTSASTVARANRPRHTFKIAFDGSVAPDVHFLLALISNGAGGTGFATFNSSAYGPTSPEILSTIDFAFFDWRNAFGWPLEIWLGRFGGQSPGPTYPVQFGPFGLLFNTDPSTWEDTTNGSNANSADGLRVALNLSNVADLRFQGVWVRVNGGLGSFTYPSGEDAYGADVNVKLSQGFRLGAYYVGNTIANAGTCVLGSAACPSRSLFGSLYHLYGSGGGSNNPGANIATPFGNVGGFRCLASGPGTAIGGAASVAGTNCPAQGNGWGAYATWDALPGIHLDVEAAQWSDSTPGGGTDDGFQVLGTFNLGTLLNWKGAVVSVGYQYYGANFYPPYGGADWDVSTGLDHIYPGNAQGVIASASWAINPTFTVFANWLSGNNVSNSQSLQEWQAGVTIRLAPNASILFKYRDLSMNGIDQENVYRAEFNYRF